MYVQKSQSVDFSMFYIIKYAHLFEDIACFQDMVYL